MVSAFVENSSSVANLKSKSKDFKMWVRISCYFFVAVFSIERVNCSLYKNLRPMRNGPTTSTGTRQSENVQNIKYKNLYHSKVSFAILYFSVFYTYTF